MLRVTDGPARVQSDAAGRAEISPFAGSEADIEAHHGSSPGERRSRGDEGFQALLWKLCEKWMGFAVIGKVHALLASRDRDEQVPSFILLLAEVLPLGIELHHCRQVRQKDVVEVKALGTMVCH